MGRGGTAALKGIARKGRVGESMTQNGGRRARRWFRRGLGLGAGLGLAVAVLAPGGAWAAGWSEFRQGDLKGAVYSAESGEGVFVLACDASGGSLLQVSLPADAKGKAGRTTSLPIFVDGHRFTYSGKVVEEDTTRVLMADLKTDAPLVKALAAGKEVKVGKGRSAYGISLDGAAAPLAAFSAACGGASGKPAPAASQASEQSATAQAPAAALADSSPHAASTGRAAPVPPADELAAAIFVDKAEGRRLAGKLKIAPVDLNGDGADEAIVTVKDPDWCGENGCTLFVVSFSGGSAHIIGEFIGLGLDPAKSRRGEWRDLTLRGPGGTELESFVEGSYR